MHDPDNRPDNRPDPGALLIAAQAEGRGRLKLFLGAAPGVGKTWEMLAQAKRRLAEGCDVLAGVIESHGRAETEAQAASMPLLASRTLSYRGQILAEFDIDAALARKPALLLVDELAHTNAPGSRHAKRWEDVAELLANGIDVWATLNIQHLESLNDDIARITGIRPTETLPDHVLDMADSIELVDVPPADLRARLASGKIYRPEIARRALDGFFKEGNLSALREIALRRAASHVDTHMRGWMRRTGVAGPWPASETILALVGRDRTADAVLRQAKKLADALHAPWVALHIEQPDQSADTPQKIQTILKLAASLGAEIDVRPAQDRDMVASVLAAAHAHNATHLVIGRAAAPAWRRALRRTLSYQLLRRAPDFVLHVVPAPSAARPAPPRTTAAKFEPWPWLAIAFAIAAVTLTGTLLRKFLPVEAADMVYLAVVVASAARWGAGPALFAALLGVLAWDFFFIPPLYTVTIQHPRDVITGIVFVSVAVLTGRLAGHVRAEAQLAGARIESLRRISSFSRKLGEPLNEADLLSVIVREAASLADAAVVLCGDPDLTLRAALPAAPVLDESAMAAARWAASHGEPTGRGSTTLPYASWRFTPLQTTRGTLGVLGVRPTDGAPATVAQTLDTLADQAAVALERVRLTADAARASALLDTQGLRTALLASLGHDLRTPLAAIQGAAGTLRSVWAQLDEATRLDLLASIEDDVRRMTRFLANITDLTRLETGEVHARREHIYLADVVEAAISRLPAALQVVAKVPPELQALGDFMLLEQVLFNVLDNALKYAPAGSMVRVRAKAIGDRVRLDVIDEGIGIPPDDLAHVFDSFFRVTRGDRTLPGTGLGLAIARGLLGAMGGDIAAISPNPEAPSSGFPGTIVTISLPAATDNPGNLPL